MPKGLTQVGDRPFLDILIDALLNYGFRRIIFCMRYMKEQINAGIYVLNQATFVTMPPPPFSLEQDFFPKQLEQANCFALVNDAELYDIGPPERYATINQIFVTDPQ